MARIGDFPFHVKTEAYERQGGMCAFCGVRLAPPSSGERLPRGVYAGEAHHLRPLLHGGSPDADNCVYLCYAHHKLIGHGMAPYGIDNQGGSSRTWIHVSRKDLPYWEAKR
jgi:predicted restriction endonuclease